MSEEMLIGEGDTRMQIRRRHHCAVCGVPATHRVSYLLKNARNNPASSGYCQDDCTYRSDAEEFSCDDHTRKVERDYAPQGMSWCATFDGKRRPHMLLYWDEA